jgi:RNA polymerase sigma-70 factor, ECF subfamily
MSHNNKFDPQVIAELVTGALEKNKQSQSMLIELTQNKLFKFCMLLGNSREQAEDLCQEAYVKAFLNLDKLSSSTSFYAWLCQIAKNLNYDFHRKHKESLAEQESMVENEQDSSDPNYESLLLVRKILGEFDDDSKFLLLMVELEGMSYAETAQVLKTSEDAVRSKLHRLRQEFMKKLK